MDVGDTWNESELLRDGATGRGVRRLTTRGRINQTPTYHTNSGFSADGRFLVFASIRDGATWVLRAEAATGELKALWRAPGVGDRNYIHRGMGLSFADVNGRGICGNRVCMAPRSHLAVFTCESAVHAVDIHSARHRVLLPDAGGEWIFGAPCVSPDERHVAVALSSAHPELLAGRAPTRSYTDFADHRLRIIRVPIDGGGQAEVLYERRPAQSAHCAFCPADGDLLYFDLDLPPRYWGGSDGKTPRIWLLELSTGRARPLKRDYPGPFQVHQAWLWDGSGMAYHGPAIGGGEYFGIAAPDGRTLWERVFRAASHYGHLTPDPRRPALIIDGSFASGRLQWLYYDDVGRDAAQSRRQPMDEQVGLRSVPPHTGERAPELECICLHGTQWGSIPGQYSHPHPLTDPAGRWISFTAARSSRSDIFVVDVGR